MVLFIIKLTIVAAITFFIGGIGTFALYRFRLKDFIQSGLALKIAMWIPLWFIYILSSYYWPEFFLVAIVLFILVEIFWVNKKNDFMPRITYACFFILGVGMLTVYVQESSNPSIIFLSILAACALSDVVAFFAGKLCGYHFLPKVINPGKSWEGVAGQVVGGTLGLERVKALGAFEISIGISFLVGLGSACGDICNSYFKRILQITNWSNFIPGHGGIGDRFASLAGTGYFLFAYKYFIISYFN